MQKEKETLAVNYEKEEEFLTNELSRKLMQVNYLFSPLIFLPTQEVTLNIAQERKKDERQFLQNKYVYLIPYLFQF